MASYLSRLRDCLAHYSVPGRQRYPVPYPGQEEFLSVRFDHLPRMLREALNLTTLFLTTNTHSRLVARVEPLITNGSTYADFRVIFDHLLYIAAYCIECVLDEESRPALVRNFRTVFNNTMGDLTSGPDEADLLPMSTLVSV